MAYHSPKTSSVLGPLTIKSEICCKFSSGLMAGC